MKERKTRTDKFQVPIIRWLLFKTSEKWQFAYLDKKTKKAGTKNKDVEYKVTYILEFRDKKWMVNDIYFD